MSDGLTPPRSRRRRRALPDRRRDLGAIARRGDPLRGLDHRPGRRSELLQSPSRVHRPQLRDQAIAEMTAPLAHPGDSYQAPDRVRDSLTFAPNAE